MKRLIGRNGTRRRNEATHEGDGSNEESRLITVQRKTIFTASEQEVPNWVRSAALFIAKQLRRRQTAGGGGGEGDEEEN